MNTEERERIRQNVQHTAGLYALRKIRGIVDEVEREDEVRLKLLRAFLRYGWMVLLLLAAGLARYYGVL